VTAREIAVVFECEGADLVGIVHRPEIAGEIGVLTVVAGGPQYRAGVGRGLVGMGRELSARGIPVMRFDHRGLGDSAGQFLGFEHLEDDLRAAIAVFKAQVPQLQKIVLWGGCDAASAIMIHAARIPEVASIMVGNPFVSSSTTQAAVVRQHYLNRLGEWSFWRKVFSLEYNVLDYAKEAMARLKAKLTGVADSAGTQESSSGSASKTGSFIDRMLSGATRFKGPMLFVMSGQSLVSKEFDELLTRSPAWKEVYQRPGNRRVDLPDADQAFSSQDDRERVNEAIFDWLRGLRQE
jgi:exosortase A-associated hydrolase 1